jgi:hypothetical protein
MAKSDSLKDQLKKAAKRRSQRPAPAAPPTPASPQYKSDLAAALNVIVESLLAVDRERDDINDRLLLRSLKAFRRSRFTGDMNVDVLQEAMENAIHATSLEMRVIMAATDELISLVEGCGSNRTSPRAALMYLHSMAN